jgi:hypothetical protein
MKKILSKKLLLKRNGWCKNQPFLLYPENHAIDWWFSGYNKKMNVAM